MVAEMHDPVCCMQITQIVLSSLNPSEGEDFLFVEFQSQFAEDRRKSDGCRVGSAPGIKAGEPVLDKVDLKKRKDDARSSFNSRLRGCFKYKYTIFF